MPAKASELTFQVLGPVEAVRDGASLALGGRRQRTLLAMLLRQPGRSVGTDQLVDELWHGEPPDGAATTLRSYVSRLRSALGQGAVIRGGTEGYALDAPADAVDAARFESLIRQGETALAQRAFGGAAERLSQALALWRGTPFGELADEGMLRIEAYRLSELRLQALELRIEADLALGRAAELVEELEALVAEHPYRERLWRELMLALYRSARQADALAAYRRARSILEEELGLEPGEELQALEQAILRHEVPALKLPEERHNLPAPLTTFIGRRAELGEVLGGLSQRRLVTLTGVGGVGKTRLGLEAARRALPDFPDGVYFIDLAPLSEAGLVPRQLALALEIADQPRRSVQNQLTERIGAAQLLLVLDNCEHLREACAELTHDLLSSCPQLKMLATSREPLGLPGEIDYPVPPLGLPTAEAQAEEVRASESVGLFMARARDARSGLADTDAAVRTVGRICRDLDGLPLAIELAAARAKSLSVEEIADRLRDRFRFLVSWRRVATARHRTLSEAIGWSFDLLTDDEQQVLAGLSVFAGGFTLDAVAAVCLDGEEEAALRLIERLVSASLAIAEESDGVTRYRMLETVRQFASGRLEASGEADAFKRRHAAHFRALVDEAWTPIRLDEAAKWLQRLGGEHDNLRAALTWSRDAGASDEFLRLAEGLWWFWWIHGDVAEGRRWLAEALERSSRAATPEIVARALEGAAGLAWVANELDQGRRYAEMARDRFAALGDRLHEGGALNTLGLIAQARGELTSAESLFEQARERFSTLPKDDIYRNGNLATATHNLGSVALSSGDLSRAVERYEEAMAICRADDDLDGIALCELYLGQAAVLGGRHDDAAELLGQALHRYRAVGFLQYLAESLELIGFVAWARGEAHEGATLLGAADAMRERIGHRLSADTARTREPHIAAIRSELGEEAFTAASAKGRALPETEALDRAQRVVAR